jgi:hypothetical protein
MTGLQPVIGSRSSGAAGIGAVSLSVYRRLPRDDGVMGSTHQAIQS